jgi:hypothetical protein
LFDALAGVALGARCRHSIAVHVARAEENVFTHRRWKLNSDRLIDLQRARAVLLLLARGWWVF